MPGRFERAIEKLLWRSKYAIFLAVVASILSALILLIIGFIDILIVGSELLRVLTGTSEFDAFSRLAVTHVISAVDSFLIATVLFIFGMGLYELFISKIEEAENDRNSSRILVIHTLDDLKEKLAKVIIMALIVMFFKYAVNFHYEEVLHLLYLGIGILLLSLAVYFMHKSGASESDNS